MCYLTCWTDNLGEIKYLLSMDILINSLQLHQEEVEEVTDPLVYVLSKSISVMSIILL